MLSKVGGLAERSLKKSKKHHAIAPAALGGCGGLGQLWEAPAELLEALGELWDGLYFEKLPINRPSGRYVIGAVLNIIAKASPISEQIHENHTKIANAHEILTKTSQIQEHLNKTIQKHRIHQGVLDFRHLRPAWDYLACD